MTLVADEYLGNRRDDPALAERVETGDAVTVTVDETERRRSRFRTTASDGTDLGVVVGRELQAGDVLWADGTLVVVELDAVGAMVVRFDRVDGDTAAVTAALELGHAVGNRHRDLAVDGDRAYLPLTDSRDRLAAEVRPYLPDGATIDYEDVSPALFDEGDGLEGDHGHGPHAHTHGVHDIDPEGSR